MRRCTQVIASKLEAVDGRAVDRLKQLVRGSVSVLVEQFPFVTLLLRVCGNSETKRQAPARRRGVRRVTGGR
ncbi:hypothetical protein [Lentzea miocenica]|uniref:hypothetical protein n=1 Tax=Lentzea miocenica TaxID=3095431 RepID=UPI0038731335